MKSSNLLKTVRILTPESVDLEFNLAGVGSRALALLVDYIALMAIAIGLLLFGLLLNQQLTDLAVLLGGGTEQIELWLFAIFAIASFAIYVGYFVFLKRRGKARVRENALRKFG